MYLNAIILGIVEGLTEFLPVSSTANLIFVAKLLQIPQTEYWKFFEIFIQAGAILAVIAVFLRELKDARYLKSIFTAFIPTVIVGFVLYKIIKNVFFESYTLIAAMLIGVGILFLIIEWLVKTKKLIPNKELNEMSTKNALLLGLAQSLAVVPGVSRAGAVIVGGLSLGYTRTEATLFSFMLAVPTILAAAGYDFLKTNPDVVFQNIGVTITGFVTAFITAFIVVRWFIRYMQKGTLVPFAIYRFIVGAALLFLH